MKSSYGWVTITGFVCAMLGAVGTAEAEPTKHDGFYMQLTGGLGYYSASADAGGVDQSYSGTTLPMSLMLGGTLKPGLAIGGGFFVDYSSSPTFEQNGMEVEGLDFSQYVVGLGLTVDYYLKPEGGTHFQGFLGWGGLETSTDAGAGGSDPTGLVVFVAGGHDWFITDAWSAGVMGRLAYGAFSLNDVSFPTIAPSLLGTLTYH